MSACIYLKLNIGRFSKAMSVSSFASLSEHPGFNWSWIIPLFWLFLWPPVLSDRFLPDWNTASLRSQLLCTHHKELENVWVLGGIWFLTAWKLFFLCWELLSPSASKTVFNSWNYLLLLKICKRRENKCLAIVSLRCSNFNSSFKYFYQVSHVTGLVFWLLTVAAQEHESALFFVFIFFFPEHS